MEVKEIKLLDGSGGLNNRDQPSQIQVNEFSKLENLLTDEGGWPGKMRAGQLLMQYAPIDPIQFRAIDTISALSGAGPGLITITCTTTEALKVGTKLDFTGVGGPPAAPSIETGVSVTAVLSATQFQVVNTVPFLINYRFTETGTIVLVNMNQGAGAEPNVSPVIGSQYVSLLGASGFVVGGIVGLLPTSAPLARKPLPLNPFTTGFFAQGNRLTQYATRIIDTESSVMFEGWIKINPTFTGKPTTIIFLGLPFTLSNSGGAIAGITAAGGFGGPNNLGQSRNGINLWRDWDAVNNVDSSDPYITFNLRTVNNGLTTLTSKFLPTSTWLFIRASYISSIGKIRLRINGEIHAEASATGLIDDDAGLGADGYINMGGSLFWVVDPAPLGVGVGLDILMDEMRIKTQITEAEEALQPFKEPRGKPWTLSKANGIKQLVVGAGDGLFFTSGDGAWTPMNDAVHDVLGAESFSSVADWDASQISDGLFLQNGLDAPKVWDGSKLWPWGESVTPLTLANVLGAGPGIGFIGNVDYYYTFLYGSEETGPSPISTVALTALFDEVDISDIKIGPIPCTGRKIYRVKKTGPDTGKIYLVRQINDNVTTALAGAYVNNADPNLDGGREGVPEATLGTGAYVEMSALVRFTKTPKAKYTLANQNRAWLTGNPNDQYSAYYSERDAPHVFLPLSFVTANADAGPLIGLAKYYTETHASKGGNSTLVLRGDNPSNWTQWEILHPTIGAVDHWSFVHRTIPQSDSYRLCFWGKDGAYAYAGHDFEKISDLIIGTTSELTADNGNKQAITVTTQNDWEAAVGQSGSITANAFSPSYEQDGMREVSGQLRSVDQLNYIGLWKGGGAPLVPPKVISIEKGPLEGEFVFSTDSDANLYRTADNFVTKTILTTLPDALHRIIEIRYASVVGVDTYFLFEADPATQGGAVMKWDGALTTTAAGPFFWQADVGCRHSGITYDGSHIGIGHNASLATIGYTPWQGVYADNGGFLSGLGANAHFYSDNVYLNHSQKPRFTSSTGLSGQNALMRGGGIGGPCSSWVANWYDYGIGVVPPDFYSVAAIKNGFQYSIAPAQPLIFTADGVGEFDFSSTHRETALFSNGSFRPQSFWDSRVVGVGGQKIYFVAAGAEDVNSNRNSSIYSLTPAGALVAIRTNQSYFAITTDSDPVTPRCWFTETFMSDPGFSSVLTNFTLTAPAIVQIGISAGRNLVLRLSWNKSNNRIVATGKAFYTTGMYDYKGFIGSLNTTTGALTYLKLFNESGNVTGAVPLEIAYQDSATGEFSHYVAMQYIQANEPNAIYKVAAASAVLADVSVYKGAPYIGLGASAPVNGIISNLLFVPQSGAPNYLWADRVYWYAPAPTTADSRMIQLGVTGSWMVRVDYISPAFSTGGFTAFDSFDVDFQGNTLFYLRNAASIGALAASELSVSPNQNITEFPAPANIFQFRISFDWNYSTLTPTSQYTDFVQIGYFSGSATLPRIVGWQWKGRTYWSVAEVGQTKNNLVVVYQKDNKWATYTGWSIKGTAEFLGKLVALQDFSLVEIEVGKTDLGNLIRFKARSGYIMDSSTDKCIRDMKFNLQSYVNNKFPTKSGYIKIVPYGANTRLPADWLLEIPATPTVEPRQSLGFVTTAAFPYQYARAFALEILTSDETGLYAPAVDQVANMAGLILKLFVSSDRETIVRP